MRLSFILELAALALLRSWRTSVVLSALVVAAVATLVFLSALATGIGDAMIANSTGLFAGHIGGELPAGADPGRLRAAPGVRLVLERRQLPALLGAGERREPVVLCGVDPAGEAAGAAYWRKTAAGRPPAAGERALYLGQETAARLGLAPGDRAQVEGRDGRPGTDFVVAGIYRTGLGQLDRGLAFCPAAALPGPAATTGVAVFLEPGAPLQEALARCRELAPGAELAAWTTAMPDLGQLIDLNRVCMALVVVLVFAIVSLGVSCTFLVFTLKNLREHGVLKAMGMRPADTALLIAAQVALLSAGAAAAGALLGAAAAGIAARTGIDIGALTSHNRYFAVSGVLHPRLGAPDLLVPPLAAVAAGLLAAAWPVAFILRREPAEILRHG